MNKTTDPTLRALAYVMGRCADEMDDAHHNSGLHTDPWQECEWCQFIGSVNGPVMEITD